MRRLGLGPERIESVRWSIGATAAGRAPAPGELVSGHWDWVCDRLTGAQAAQLAAWTAHQLAAANQPGGL